MFQTNKQFTSLQSKNPERLVAFIKSRKHFIYLLRNANKSCAFWKLFQCDSAHVGAGGAQTTQHILNCLLNWTTVFNLNTLPF